MNSADPGARCATMPSTRKPLRPVKRSRDSGIAARAPATSAHSTEPTVTIRLLSRYVGKLSLPSAVAKMPNEKDVGIRSYLGERISPGVRSDVTNIQYVGTTIFSFNFTATTESTIRCESDFFTTDHLPGSG